MDIETITAIAAGICMAICQVPQAVKIYKAGKAEGLSLGMQIILTSGIFFWFLTGVILSLKGNGGAGTPMWISNGFCLIFCIYVLVMCIRTRIQEKKQEKQD